MSKKKKTTKRCSLFETKRCSRCKEIKSRDEFYSDPSRKTLLSCWCKKCCAEYNQKLNYPVSVKQKRCRKCQIIKPASKFCRSKRSRDGLASYCRKCVTELAKRWSVSLREQILAGYGAVCARCKETDKRVLEIDHMKDNGAEERRKFKRNYNKLHKSIIKRNFPKDEYQLLCKNCNWLKELERREAQVKAVKE